MKNRYFSILSLILVNLYPLYGVKYLGWNIGEVLFLYWVETVVIGFFNVLKIALNTNSDFNSSPLMINGKPFNGSFRALKILLGSVFVVHYGLFNLVHFGFLYFFILRFYLEGNFLVTLLVPIALIFMSHFVSLGINYFKNGEYKKIFVQELFLAPYKRIFVMQLVLILGGFAIGQILKHYINDFPIYVFICVKIVMDLFFHVGEHSKNQKLPIKN